MAPFAPLQTALGLRSGAFSRLRQCARVSLVSMQFIPVTTRILQPPQDDLLSVIRGSLTDIKNGDVMLISSKVVAIHEGRCVPKQQ